MPSRSSPVWCLTAFLLLVFPLLNFIYWPEVLRSGVLPPDGDSIAIPMFGSVLATLVVSPFVFAIAWLCLRRFNPETRLWSWRRDRPFRSFAASLLFGAASAAVAAAIFDGVRRSMPWYEYLWPAYFSLWLPWLLALRAAAIEQLDYKAPQTEG